MKKLSVIIPYFNDLDNLNGLINNLKKQVLNKEIYDVIIIDDHSEKALKIEDLGDLEGLNVRIYNSDINRGSGVARQLGIFMSESEFVTFIDSDDILYQRDSLSLMIHNIMDNDILVTTFVEEMPNKKLLPHSHDKTWMHGKMYRRSFLLNNNIEFHPNLRCQEDGYFNNLVFSETSKIKMIPIITYVWRNNKQSITRSNQNEYNYTRFKDYIVAMHLTCMELCKRKNWNLVNMYCSGVAYVFYYLQLSGWKHFKAYYNECNKQFLEFYKAFEDLFDEINKLEFIGFMHGGRESVLNHEHFVDKMTFKQFIKANKLKERECFNF